MSTCEPQTDDRDGGFSLVEIVVAMGLLAAVLTASLPMFLSMVRSTVVVKQQTQAKNLGQERLEQVRDLRFHVDNQNGPFLDLLDIYYTDARLGYARGAVSVGDDELTGVYVPTGGGTGGEPTAPYYRVGTVAGELAGAPGFDQVITAQFLEADGRTILPPARFANYNSQAAGVDAPPTLTVGITVITKWQELGRQKLHRAYTQITETGPEPPVIQSQARAVSVGVSSTAADGTSLTLQGGVASLDGAQSNGSSVSGYAAGAVARRTGQPVAESRNARFQLPAQPVSEAGSADPVTSSACAWYGHGRSSVGNVTADVAGGLPRSPTNVDDAVTPRNAISGQLDNDGSNACGLLGFTNVVDSGAPLSSADPIGSHFGTSPYVKVGDATGTGTALSGSAYVTSTPLTSAAQKTFSGGSVKMARPLVLFPTSPESATQGLVTAQLTSASVDCTSGTALTPGTIAAKYSLTLRWWGRVGPTGTPAAWHEAVWTYDSTTDTAPVPASGSEPWEPSNAFLSNGRPLSDLVTADVPAAVATGTTSGQRGFPGGIMTLTTVPTLSNESQPGFSAIKVRLGQLTCVADDER